MGTRAVSRKRFTLGLWIASGLLMCDLRVAFW